MGTFTFNEMCDTPMEKFIDSEEVICEHLKCKLVGSSIAVNRSRAPGPQSVKDDDELLSLVFKVSLVNRRLVYCVNSRKYGETMLLYFYKNINGNMDTLTEGQALFPEYIPRAAKHIDNLISSDHEWHFKRNVILILM